MPMREGRGAQNLDVVCDRLFPDVWLHPAAADCDTLQGSLQKCRDAGQKRDQSQAS